MSGHCEEETTKTFYVRNFPFPAILRFDPEIVGEVIDYMPHDGDIILCSFPKTGVTWLEHIVYSILHKGESLSSDDDQVCKKYLPYMEMSGTPAIEALNTPRCYQTHMPLSMLKINQHAKYIYIRRHPMDTLVSYYYFAKLKDRRSLTFDNFFGRFLEGTLPYGDYFDHVNSVYPHKNDPNFKVLSYEDLQREKETQVCKLAKFLGEKYHQALVEDTSLMRKILATTEFNYMKENVGSTLFVKDGETVQTLAFTKFRKGIVGDGKNVLSREQANVLKGKMLEEMKDKELANLWALQFPA